MFHLFNGTYWRMQFLLSIDHLPRHGVHMME